MTADNKMHLWINFIASFKVSLGNCIKYFAIIVILLDNCWSSGSGKCWTFNFLLFYYSRKNVKNEEVFFIFSFFFHQHFILFEREKLLNESQGVKDEKTGDRWIWVHLAWNFKFSVLNKYLFSPIKLFNFHCKRKEIFRDFY